MSNAETFRQSQVFTAALGPLVAGALAPAAVANFNNSSRMLYIVRTTAGATANGIPRVALGAPAAFSEQVKVGVYSSVNTDVGTYTLYWVNDLPQSAATLSTTAQNGVVGVVYAV